MPLKPDIPFGGLLGSCKVAIRGLFGDIIIIIIFIIIIIVIIVMIIIIVIINII